MKKLTFTTLFVMSAIFAFSQMESPVKWSYTAVKKTANEYQIVLTATFAKPWHIYSQKTPDGGPVPTKISFSKNPLITTKGEIKEVGALHTTHDKNFGVDVKYYSDKVQFIQTVTTKAKTNISGTIEYMVCDDHQCLPPTTKSFSVKL